MRHERLSSGGYWLAPLLAGAALGAFLPMVGGSWNVALVWVCVGLMVVAVIAVAFSEAARLGKARMLERNGTAYIIYEEGRFWKKQDIEGFRKDIRRQFARVVQVPGPRELEPGWDWSLDAAARNWDGMADQLVRALRVLCQDEKHNGITTPNSVFIWAYWAVAVAFGMRLAAADNAPELDVWHRPSRAREAAVYPEIWSDRPHRITVAQPAEHALPEMTEHDWKAELAVTRVGGARPGAKATQVGVLLVRFSSQSWGPLPGVAVTGPQDQQPVLSLYDAVGVIPAGQSDVDIHELRCVPPTGGFAWDTFPVLAARAAAWIQQNAGQLADDGQTVVLGTVLPQEVGLELGILAGQPSRRSGWPADLWPIVAEPVRYDLVIPHLQLGTAAISLRRQ